MNKKGFSLIELIVSITIIAILTVVATLSFGSVNKRARDSRRAADLQKIGLALEMARQVGVTYPANLNVLTTNNYMPALPTDPKTGSSADYVYTPLTGFTYTLSATMEDLGSTNAAGMHYVIRNP